MVATVEGISDMGGKGMLESVALGGILNANYRKKNEFFLLELEDNLKIFYENKRNKDLGRCCCSIVALSNKGYIEKALFGRKKNVPRMRE